MENRSLEYSPLEMPGKRGRGRPSLGSIRQVEVHRTADHMQADSVEQGKQHAKKSYELGKARYDASRQSLARKLPGSLRVGICGQKPGASYCIERCCAGK